MAAALTRLQEVCDRQAERLAALPAEVKAEITLRTGEVAERLSAQVLDQTKALNASQGEMKRALDLLANDMRSGVEALKAGLAEGQAKAEKALEARLAADSEAARAKLEEHRAAQAEAAAALRRDLAVITADLKTGTEALKAVLTEGQARTQQALAADMATARDLIERKANESREQVEAKLREMREANDARLADIQKSVNEQLQSAVEKQMAESFNRVIDQFAAVQKAMGDVQAVTSQIGDLKRLFSNVKTRGGWGEAQVKALLDDILPAGSYEMNLRPREDSAEQVEFAIAMPAPSGERVWLPVDAKFPIEDYDRLIAAAEAGDAEGERAARKALGDRLKFEAQKIASKYICPPRTVEFAVLYLPTDGLFAEVARIPGLLDEIGRTHRVMVLGPSLLPAMLRTIQLGHVTLALSRNADAVRDLLAATKAEMLKMDEVLKKLGKQVGTVGRTILSAQTRTRAVTRKLRAVDAISFERAEELLEIESEAELEEVEEA